MKEYYMQPKYDGFEIVKYEPELNRKVYLMYVYKENYRWCTDFTYSHKFTEKTARKHLEILRKKGGKK